MHKYKHTSGAIVEVDEKGKKTIHHYGKEFRNFTELKKWENENREFVRKYRLKELYEKRAYKKLRHKDEENTLRFKGK